MALKYIQMVELKKDITIYGDYIKYLESYKSQFDKILEFCEEKILEYDPAKYKKELKGMATTLNYYKSVQKKMKCIEDGFKKLFDCDFVENKKKLIKLIKDKHKSLSEKLKGALFADLDFKDLKIINEENSKNKGNDKYTKSHWFAILYNYLNELNCEPIMNLMDFKYKDLK